MHEPKKNLMFLIPSLSFGGAEVMMLQQIKWLRQRGWEVCVGVLSGQNEQRLIESLDLPKDKLFIAKCEIPVLAPASVKFAVQHFQELSAFAKRNNIEVIIANMPLAHFWGRLVKLRNKALRLVVYHHATQYKANPLNTLMKVLFNKIQLVLARRADDLTICISDAVKQDIASHFFVRNGYVLFNSVEDRRQEIIDRVSKQNKARNWEEVVMIIPGRLQMVKGHLFFLKVFCRLRQQVGTRGQLLKLIIAGGGPLQGEIRRFIDKNGLKDCVSMTGTLDNIALLEQMYAADLVVVPSLEEGLGIVAIESLMLGKTVLASNAGGLKEVIRNGENGYLFLSNDEEDCLRICKEVIENYPKSLLPEQTLTADYKKRFSFEYHMQSLAELMQSLN